MTDVTVAIANRCIIYTCMTNLFAGIGGIQMFFSKIKIFVQKYIPIYDQVVSSW